MKTQSRWVGDAKYTFVCMEGRNGYDVIEVYVPIRVTSEVINTIDPSRKASTMYPKFRYERKDNWPWQLNGKSSAESARILDVLGEIWDATL